MRSIVIIFLLAFLWSCTSCTESKPENDELITDNDNTGVSDPDIMDKTNNDDDVSDTSDDKSPDTNDTDTLDDDITEEEFIDDCDVKLIDAPFPYKDGESLTFCRPGCDTPTEKDPQCMSNLWKEQNFNLCHQHPEYDCCGYPCVLESLKPMTKEETDKELVYNGKILVPMHKCDLYLPIWQHDGTHGVVKSWNMSAEKVGFYLFTLNLSAKDWSVQSKYVSYDIATQKYNFILPARGQEQSYFKGKRIGLVSDKRSLELNNSNIYLAYIGDDGLKTLAYNKKVHRLAYEPALNDKWAFVNLQETENSPYKMMYAKVGEWNWTALGEGFGWYPSLVGNSLSFVDDDVNGWICDLSKAPQKLSDCLKFNNEGERIEYLFFDKDNENRLAYYDKYNQKIVLAEKEAGSYKKTDLVTEFTEESSKNAFSLLPRKLKGDLLLYEEVTTDGSSYGGLLCYYRIDKDKKYCMKKMEDDVTFDDGNTKFPYGFAEFEGKWLLYQKRNSTPLILRDMECYCKEEGVCPFEE